MQSPLGLEVASHLHSSAGQSLSEEYAAHMLSAAAVEASGEEEEVGATVEEVGAEGGAVAGVAVGASHFSARGVPKVGLGKQIFAPGRLNFLPRGCTPKMQRHLPSPPLAEQESSVFDLSQAPSLESWESSLPVGRGWQNQPPQTQLCFGQLALVFLELHLGAAGAVGSAAAVESASAAAPAIVHVSVGVANAGRGAHISLLPCFLPIGCGPHLQRHVPSPPALAQASFERCLSQAAAFDPLAAWPVGRGAQNQPAKIQRSFGQLVLPDTTG